MLREDYKQGNKPLEIGHWLKVKNKAIKAGKKKEYG